MAAYAGFLIWVKVLAQARNSKHLGKRAPKRQGAKSGSDPAAHKKYSRPARALPLNSRSMPCFHRKDVQTICTWVRKKSWFCDRLTLAILS